MSGKDKPKFIRLHEIYSFLDAREFLKKLETETQQNVKLWNLITTNILLPEFKNTRNAGFQMFFGPSLMNIYFIFNRRFLFKRYFRIGVPILFFINFNYKMNEDLVRIATGPDTKMARSIREISKTLSWFNMFKPIFKKEVEADFKKTKESDGKEEKKEEPKEEAKKEEAKKEEAKA